MVDDKSYKLNRSTTRKPGGHYERGVYHAVKAVLAVRLRKETTMSYEWIAERLHMGAKSTVSNLASANRRNQGIYIARTNPEP